MPQTGQRYLGTFPTELVAPHLRGWIDAECEGAVGRAATLLRCSPRRLYGFLTGEFPAITFDVADRLFCGMGDPIGYWRSDDRLRAVYEGEIVWEADMFSPITEESEQESLERKRELKRVAERAKSRRHREQAKAAKAADGKASAQAELAA